MCHRSGSGLHLTRSTQGRCAETNASLTGKDLRSPSCLHEAPCSHLFDPDMYIYIYIYRGWSADATSISHSQFRCDVFGSSITFVLVYARDWNANSPAFTCTETREETICGRAIKTVSSPGTKKWRKKTRTHLDLGGNVECSELEHEEAHHRFLRKKGRHPDNGGQRNTATEWHRMSTSSPVAGTERATPPSVPRTISE